MRISVFCASSAKVDPEYFKAASRLGEILARNRIAVNYGGGEVGLMGALAGSVMKHGGEIRGVIPEFMVDQGWMHPGVKDMVVVADMYERMKHIHKDVDAYIALPGGVGTLSELLDTVTMKQLGQVLQPIVIINTAGFFDPFLELLGNMVKGRFMREIHREIWSVVDGPGQVLEAIRTAPKWDGSKIKLAPA